MEFRKRLLALLTRAALLIGLLIALTLVVNLPWFDQELHPDLAHLPPPQPVSMSGNAFPLIYGFLASEGRDPFDAGREIVHRLSREYRGETGSVPTPVEIDRILGEPDSARPWYELYPSMTCDTPVGCADQLIADIDAAAPLHPRIELLLARYEQILDQPRFEENLQYPISGSSPSYGPLIAIQRIRLAILFQTANHADFLTQIARDTRLWKLLLRDGSTLGSKMAARAGLRDDIRFLSALIRTGELSADELRRIPEVLAPLTADELDIGEAILNEFRVLSSQDYAALLPRQLAPMRLALQDTATLNEYYLSIINPARLRAALPAERYYAQHGYEDLTYNVGVFPPRIYNLGGQYLIRWVTANADLINAVSSVHDLNGLISLLHVQVEIAGRPASDPGDVILASRHRNPYTGEPMIYDRDAGTIGFECVMHRLHRCPLQIR